MKLNEFSSVRLSVSDVFIAPLRPISIIIDGTGDQTFSFNDLPYDFVISDILTTGTGKLTLEKGSDVYLAAYVNGYANISPRMYLPIKKGENFTLKFDSTNAVDSVGITILGFAHI